MKQNIREVMTRNPKALTQNATIMEAACAMRDNDIGDVVVLDNGRLCGILTDRDIVVRALAAGCDPNRTSVGEICSRALVTLTPEDSTGQAVRVMREHAIRRLPIEDGGRVVGIVTLGDVAVDADRRSALADISAAPPNV
jgi:CBS domain-containing protein